MARPAPVALSCPNCGGTVNLRGYAQTLNAVCIQCLSILDTSSPTLRIVQKFQMKQRFRPDIPLGTRGQFNGAPYEAIGFQVRHIVVEGVSYKWREYLLLNPYKGYLYLTEYDGHWNVVKTVRELPSAASIGFRKGVSHGGRDFALFQIARAETIFVMGEFPWQVRVGENVGTEDYIAPPYILSAEKTSDETVWSQGEYTPGKKIWEAFGLKGKPPQVSGVYANMPSPHVAKSKGAWRLFLLFALLLIVIMLASQAFMLNQRVFSQDFTFTPRALAESSYVTPVFELQGRPSNVEVGVNTDLDNYWLYFNFALINEQSGQAYDFGREISYYHGVDGDGSWTEGSRGDSVLIPSIPAGRYYLRVEPETDTQQQPPRPVKYRLSVTRDVTLNWPFVVAFILLVIPPLRASIKNRAFEMQRWQESDVSGSSSGGKDE